MDCVQAQYLSGNSVILDNCKTVGSIMVRIGMLHCRFASDVVVVCPVSGKVLTDDPSRIPPPVASIILKPDELLAESDVHVTLMLHAAQEDTATCERALTLCEDENHTTLLIDILDRAQQCSVESQHTIIQTLFRVGLNGTPTQRVGLNGTHALCRASGDGRKHIVERLLSARVSPNIKSLIGEPALACAAKNGHTDVVHVLLAARAKVDRADNERDAALALASASGHKNVVHVLLGARAKVNHANMAGYSALVAASMEGHRDVVDVLLSAKAHVDHETWVGGTALMYASMEGHAEVVRILLSARADVDHANVEHETALMFASCAGHTGIVKALLSAGSRGYSGTGHSTALGLALQKGHRDIVELLKAAEAQKYVRDLRTILEAFKEKKAPAPARNQGSLLGCITVFRSLVAAPSVPKSLAVTSKGSRSPPKTKNGP